MTYGVLLFAAWVIVTIAQLYYEDKEKRRKHELERDLLQLKETQEVNKYDN